MEMKIRMGGLDHVVQAQLLKGTLWVHFNGRTFTVDAGTGQRSRRKFAGGSSDQILAPMPGKVTKILVQEGSIVTQGQAVLVMEAMKMEYTLKSEIDGAVHSLSCSVGEQVAVGKVLVKITSSAEK